jgi:hypothetical protein
VLLVVGPTWKGETPKDVKQVFRSGTDLALVVSGTGGWQQTARRHTGTSTKNGAMGDAAAAIPY